MLKKKGSGKSYRLLRAVAPLSFILQSRSQPRKPLAYFDEQEKVNKPLRYAVNQRTPFEEEQQGTVILEPIVFEDGQLYVPNNNPVLQKFLEYHPDNGIKFEEVNEERNAQEELDRMDVEFDAIEAARKLELEELETVARVGLNADVLRMTSKELKRDVLLFAKSDPERFMSIMNSPTLQVQDLVARCYEEGLLRLRNKGRDVYFNLPSNKSKLITIPPGENKVYAVAEVLQKDEGIEVLKLLKKSIEIKD